MSAVNDAISYALRTSHGLYDQFIADLTASQYLHRPAAKANCAAWLTGHLILTERRILGLIGVRDLPALPEGFEQRFARDEASAGAGDFGDVTLLRPMLAEHRQRLIAAVAEMSAEQLAKPLEKPSPRFSTLGEVAHFMAIHMTMHAGQVSTIRRSLGKPPMM